MLTVLGGWLLGMAQGVRHAFEPDHLAAISTMVADQRSARTGAFYAVAWGIGHALVLLAMACILFGLKAEIPERMGNAFELLVGVMLIALGVRALAQAVGAGRTGVPMMHRHGGKMHHHAGDLDHLHLRRWTLARRPLLVGMVHGLAGSGALTALVLAKLPSTFDRLVFIALFGAGATLGMALLARIAGTPLAHLRKTRRGMPALLTLTGTLSLSLGVVWGYSAALRVWGG
jgi:cytochrome c biogenesis protein CcdA